MYLQVLDGEGDSQEDLRKYGQDNPYFLLISAEIIGIEKEEMMKLKDQVAIVTGAAWESAGMAEACFRGRGEL